MELERLEAIEKELDDMGVSNHNKELVRDFFRKAIERDYEAEGK